ncbi:MAG: hypothetical protein LBD31_08920 [Treponema sp.]|nr:hypothetical protein [Treponema sp.]
MTPPLRSALSLAAEERLGIRADEDALEKLESFCRKSRKEGNPRTLETLFDSGEASLFLTVNETYFFREEDHFRFLRTLLPSFEGPLRICCAAVSTGCEAYSIAMVIEEYNRTGKLLAYGIDAFDINPRVIETAKGGVYGPHSLREDGNGFRFLAGSWLETRGNHYAVREALKKNIRFFVHNLMEDLPKEGYDIIFFRNAWIYFSPRGRERVLSNLAGALAEGGKLIVGVSETAGVNHSALAEKNHAGLFYFEKIPEGSAVFDCPARAFPSVSNFPAGSAPVRPRAAGAEGPAKKNLDIDAAGVGGILAREEEAADLEGRFQKGEGKPEGFNGDQLAASALRLLGRGHFAAAGPVLDFLETRNGSSFTSFLRGEYFFFQDMFTEAEFHYKISLDKNGLFWPACYRLSFLAPVEAVRKHRAAHALKSIERTREMHYEVFIGGFSPDYYLGALSKGNAEKEDPCSFPG